MSDINAQIDAFAALMKARAAKFDDEREFDEAVTTKELLDRARKNLASAIHRIFTLGRDETNDLADCANLCALIASRLVPAGAQEPEA